MEINSSEVQFSTFITRINDLISSKLILVDKHISSLLKFVAATPQIGQCVADTLQSVSYSSEFEKARTCTTEADGRVRARLVLPQDNNRIVTFLVCLLAEIDNGQRNILDFLQEYFFDKDTQVSYNKFCDAMLRPFKKACEAILFGNLDQNQNTTSKRCSDVYFAAEEVYISSQAYPQLLDELQFLVDRVEREFSSGKAQKADMLLMCEALYNSVVSRNPKLINLFWIGLFYTFKTAKFAETNISKLEGLLYKNNLIS